LEYLQSQALTVARFVAKDELVQQVQTSVAAADAFSVRFQQALTALENWLVALSQAARIQKKNKQRRLLV
jgi:ABC-type transport system involved in Fe-S cluster assembly fused permease/ATPase subunit